MYLDKRRLNTGKVKGDKISGNVANKKIIILDDMISTGKTIKLAVDAIEAYNGELLAVCATHGLFVGDAEKNLEKVKKLFITDTIPPFRLEKGGILDRLQVIETARIFAQAIKRTEEGGSLSDLFI